MGELPRYHMEPTLSELEKPRTRRARGFSLVLLTLIFGSLLYFPSYWSLYESPSSLTALPVNSHQILSRCASIKTIPGPPPDFYDRIQSDRFEPGTRPTLIHNATIWTGGDLGHEEIAGDLLLDGGIIKWVGGFRLDEAKRIFGHDLVILDAYGGWVTPGIVDLHSHIGVDSVPELNGASDTNSLKGITQPWLRSLDGLNTHDESYALSISGGVTSVNVLPGSANAIGGQAFPIKLRRTRELSPSSKLIEQPGSPNSTGWRQMKHACGENPSRVYKGTRMDTIWAFRAAYNEARKLVQQQDSYCTAAEAGQWTGLGEFPDELKWEALADVIRGKVKVHNHCYESVDFDGIVRLSNEFQFPIAAFHHAHEAYLVPDLIKKTWGPTPAIAIFATNARYKREGFRGSEFAARIMADHDLRVVMKSDHPVLNSRFLLYEAQQAHFYGLSSHLALASVTTTPATVLGLNHRIGYAKPGFDADLVVWDSHPLSLGATPKQVFIDGIPQLSSPYVHAKPPSFQSKPTVPNFDKEAAEAVKYEGLPPLTPTKKVQNVVFTNVRNVWSRVDSGDGVTIEQTFDASALDERDRGGNTVVVVETGKIKCTGTARSCQVAGLVGYDVVDLDGGSLAPGLTSFGAPLGLGEISGEVSTKDGTVYDPLSGTVPSILGGDKAIIRAVDGLEFATRDALLAYRSGVTTGISSPTHSGVFSGLGTFFSLGAANKLETNAVIQETTALHVSVKHFSGGQPSISTQVAALRRLLLDDGKGDQGKLFALAAKGKIPLVVEAESANIIATLLTLKKEVHSKTGHTMSLTIVGAAEAHLLAEELAQANVGVVVVPSRTFPKEWQQRQSLPGPPLSDKNPIAVLLSHNVTVGIGIEEAWSARNTRFDAAWIALESPDLTKAQAISLVTTDLEKLLGGKARATEVDVVAYSGGDMFDFSKVMGIISPRRGLVDLL